MNFSHLPLRIVSSVTHVESGFGFAGFGLVKNLRISIF